MKKKFAIILAGCGVYDGAEIHEATLTMLAISRQGAEYQCFAPDVDQTHVVNHLTGKEMNERRNVLVESARIARGNILSLSDFHASEYDAIVFPGGFGVAKNLCTFAFDGVECSVNEEVRVAVNETYKAGKPIGALCISPVLIAKILGGVEVTIGMDPKTASAVKSMGGQHVNTTHGEVVVDKRNKIVTTPCYMLDANISQIADGADHVIRTILGMV
ncbi:enhancing lycopene biosynthesis protein 2 [Bacteroidales bacterium 6E]|nr:enhancing lycopene biosynthesis protein 2 [Bacteroidales bacterium 6E]